jgi:hypothetical protein
VVIFPHYRYRFFFSMPTLLLGPEVDLGLLLRCSEMILTFIDNSFEPWRRGYDTVVLLTIS